ncbi:hypothetical protein B6U81_00675 [Thermoplasmatales archaeon ex4484_30]|nr:MAG: hypothetical protein B6U81_00675 [Thermoplasmatales archaeon ex4484_30]
MNKSFEEYITSFNKFAQKYIPPKPWKANDEALYKPTDIYNIPKKEADEMRFKAIKYAFTYHYEHSPFYKNFCKENDVTPSDIKNLDDFKKIPLIPDNFFKDYPNGKEFASWIANIFTGELPNVVINKKNPSFDEVINSFNDAGLVISYSSGTSGRHTFIPRDKKTFYASEYAIAKTVITMVYPFWEYDASGYVLMPNPLKTNIYAGKVCSVFFDVIKDVEVAIDREVTTDLIQSAMKGGIKGSVIKYAMRRENKKMIRRIINWLRRMAKEGRKIAFVGAPYILHFVMDELERNGETFNFGENGAVVTGGGWKIYEDKRMPVEEFRKRVEELLGIPPEQCLDLYGMVEGNGWMVHCPEGHYLHVPHSYFEPLVLNEEYEIMGYNEWGRFAFLDSLAMSYPGFIISGDRVRLLEHCPVCERPGPVLEPEVKRERGEEMRGCAEEVRRMLSMDLGK